MWGASPNKLNMGGRLLLPQRAPHSLFPVQSHTRGRTIASSSKALLCLQEMYVFSNSLSFVRAVIPSSEWVIWSIICSWNGAAYMCNPWSWAVIFNILNPRNTWHWLRFHEQLSETRNRFPWDREALVYFLIPSQKLYCTRCTCTYFHECTT